MVRNYPWWAIPLGLSLILESFRKDNTGKPKTGLKKSLLILIGIVLIVSSVLFLYYGGQYYAVPFTHEIFKEILR